MYVEHPLFKQPQDQSETIWRYLDLPRLLAMLESRALFFCRADLQGDPFEGAITVVDRLSELAAFETLHEADLPPNWASDVVGQMAARSAEARKDYFIHCWHLNPFESEAMWKLYGGVGMGLAIQTRYQSLIESVLDERSIMIGTVKYIDYKTDKIHSSNVNAYSPYLHKRKSFEHEREIRAIYHDPTPYWIERERLPGVSIDVDIEKVIENIYVAPNTHSWYRDLIQQVIARYGLNRTVKQSAFDLDSPLF